MATNPYTTVQFAGEDKFSQILRARQEKAAKLWEQFQTAQPARQAEVAANDNAWVNQLGLNPDSGVGAAVNLGANVVSGASRLLGDVLSLPADAMASANEMSLTKAHHEAYARVMEGKATKADMTLLNTPEKGSLTPMERFRRSGELRDLAGRTDKAFDLGSIAENKNKAGLENDLRAGFADPWQQVKDGWDAIKPNDLTTGTGQVLSGVAKLLFNAGEAAVNNKMGVLEYVAENAPQLAVGAAGRTGAAVMAAGNLGYAAENYRKGLEKYQAENNGAFPPEAERTKMALAAAGTAALEQAGDMLSLKAVKAAASKVAPAALETAKKVETAVAKGGQGGLAEALKNITGAATKGAVSEGLTEAGQTYLEGIAQRKPASAEDVYVGGAIGAMVGSGLNAGGTVAAESLGAAADKVDAVVADATKRQAQDAAAKAAVATGDARVFLDPQSPLYSPEQAVASLHQASLKESTTVEQGQANLAKALDAVQALENKDEELLAQTSRGRAALTQELQSLQATDTARKERIEQLLAQPEVADKKAAKEVSDARDALAKRLDGIYTNLQTFQADLMAKASAQSASSPEAAAAPAESPEELIKVASSLVDPADAAAGEQKQAAVRKVFSMAMASPDSVAPEALNSLANDKSNGLTEAQRTVFRQLSDARVALNKLKTGNQVRQEIYYGDAATKQVGIATYMSRVAMAATTGNQAMGERQLAGIAKFIASHQGKADAVAQAFEQVKASQDPRGLAVMRTADGNWEVKNIPPQSDLKKVAEKLRKNGGLRIHPGSQSVVEATKEEVDALNKAKIAMQGVLGQVGPTQPVAAQASTQNPSPASAPVTTLAPAPAVASPAQAPAPSASPVESVAPVLRPAMDSSPAAFAEATAAPEAVAQAEATRQPEAEQPQAAQADGAVEAAPAEATQTKEKVSALLPAIQASAAQKAKKAAGKLAESFRSLNLVGAFMGQKAQRDEAGSALPLASVPDFLSAWRADNKLVFQYLPKSVLEGLRKADGQSRFDDRKRQAVLSALKNLGNTLVQWVPVLDANMPKAEAYAKINEDFKHRDMLRFLMEEQADGSMQLTENTLTAIAVSAYQWVINEAGKPQFLDRDQITSMHSREEGDTPTREGQEALREFTAFEDKVVSSLGRAAVQALGLKASKDAPVDLMPRLQSALGTHAFAMLEKQGILSRHLILARKVVGEYFGDTLGAAQFGDKVTFTYVKFDREGSAAEQITQIKEANTYSGGVVDKLFGAEFSTRMASSKPVEFTQQFADGTHQEIPALLRKAIQADQDTPHQVIPEMLKLFTAMGKASVLRAAGAVDLDKTPVHIENERSVEAQNNNLARQYEMAFEMLGLDPFEDNILLPEEIEQLAAQEHFIQHSVARNFRVHVSTQSLNPQSSKIHRFLFTRPAWKAKIELANQALVDEFKVAIAQAMGVKTDKQPNASTLALPEVQAIFNDPSNKFYQAADAIHRGVLVAGEGVWTQETRDLVAQLSASNEGMMTLQGLMALAKYQQALASGAQDFEVTMLVGADGKTNGPILTHLALGAAASADELKTMLNRGGMYFSDEETTHYSQFAADGGLDLYQDLGSEVMKEVFTQFGGHPALDAFQKITKKLMNEDGSITSATRNLMKTPMTSFAFGSALSKSVENMEQAFFGAIYKAIEDIAKGERKDIGGPQGLIDAVNALMTFGKAKPEHLWGPMDLNALLDARLTWHQQRALHNAFTTLVGDNVAAVMKTDFAVFIERRRALNQSIEASYKIYEAAYTAAKDQLVDQLMASGEMAYRVVAKGADAGKKVPLHGLSQAQEEALRHSLGELVPVMHTDYSKREGNLGAGLWMGKASSKLSTDPLLSSKVLLGNRMVVGNGGLALETRGIEQIEMAPGAAGTPYAIHSSDSANMHKAKTQAKGTQALNVHDEIGTGVQSIATAAEAINAATVNTFLDYSPAAEARDMLGRQLVALVKAVKEGALPVGVLKSVFQSLADGLNQYTKKEADKVEPMAAGAEVLARVSDLAFRADSLRLQMIADMTTMDQYTWEGGQHVLDEKTKAEAKQRLEGLKQDPTADAAAALKELESMLANTKVEQKTGEVSPWADDIDEAPVADSITQLGVQGVRAPVVGKLGKDGVAAVNALPEADRAEAIQAVAQAAKATPPWEVSAWGELGGSPASRHHPDLVEFLASRGEVTAQELAPVLSKMFGGSANNKEMVLLMNRIVALAPADFKVVYVTPDTKADAVLEKPAYDNSRGWYVVDGDVHRAYILSPDFKQSTVHAEVVLHEMLHAVLAAEIDHPKTLAARQLVAELQDLLVEVRKHPDAAKFGNATADVHELVSWGLTNRKFQTEVLAKIQMKEHKSKSNVLVSGMKSFIASLRAFFFRDLDTKAAGKATNALTILVSNTAGLFEAVSQQSSVKQEPSGRKTFSQQAPGSQNQVMRYTTEELFDALGVAQASVANPVRSVSTGFQTHLKAVLETIVTKVHGPGGNLAANLPGTMAMTPHDVWMKAKVTGEAPFVSKITPNIVVSDQEAFVIEQVEATLRSVVSDETQASAVYRELGKLYQEAYRRLKPADFGSQSLYDFVFAVEQDATKRSDYLTRFAAMALGHQEVNQALNLATEIQQITATSRSIPDRVMALVRKGLAWLTGNATKRVDGERMNTRLAKLADQLVDLEAKKRAKLARGSLLDRFEGPSEFFQEKAQAAKQVTAKVIGSKYVRGAPVPGIGLVSSIAGVVLREQADKVVDKAMQLRDLAVKERYGIVAGLVNAVRGPSETFQILLRGMKKLEKDRQDVITDVSKIVRQAYRDAGQHLTTARKEAVSAVFLRTGTHSLLENPMGIRFNGDEETATPAQAQGNLANLADLQRLLDDPQVLDQAIRARLGALGACPQHMHYYIYQAKALGYFRATGRQRSPLGMLNAGNIARLYGTHLAGQVSEDAAVQATQVIDELSSLYALKFSDSEDLTLASEVLREELARTDGGNGVEMTLRMHHRLEQESRARLFEGSEALQMKGYTPEIYNPHTALAVARSAEEQQVLRENGYVEVEKVSVDPNDPDRRQPVLFVLKDGGQMPYTTGSLSLTGMAAKGSVRYGGMSNAFDEGVQNTAQAQRLSQLRENQSKALFSPRPDWDPRSTSTTFLTPVLNERGVVTAWRYMMQEQTKDQVLERDHRVDEVLGAMAGSIYDKETSQDQNRDVVQALHALYRQDYASRPQSFVRVSHDSPDAELREIYRLLPNSTQDTIRQVWGPNGMLVPQELMDVVFGYRKLSITKPFDKKLAQREAERLGYTPSARDRMNSIEEAFVKFTEGALYAYARGVKHMNQDDAQTFARTAGVQLHRGERAVQELVREVKDTIVVRGIKTMIGNLKSNVSLLAMYGVNPIELAHHHWVALKGATDYQKDRAELAALRLKLQTGYTRGDEAEIQRQIAVLEDSLVRNPVRELIDAGLMPTIVEDVGNDEDIYSYKAAFTKKIDGLAAGLNPNVREVGKWAYMSHDTPVYQTLSRITQLSDFVARYTLYQHVTTRKKNPLSKLDAIQLASDAFVNYDIPMHRGLQYLDDMGITMFTKYFLYIQRVLLRMGKERPLQVLLAAALHHYYGKMELVTESSALYRMGNNPFHTGPLQILGSPGDLPVVQAGMGLL